MQHEWSLHDFLSDIILPNPDINTIVEIGTGFGALSLVLGLFALKINAKLLTIDFNAEISDDAVPLFNVLGIERYIGNEYVDETKEKIIEFMGDEKTFLVCDGGHKDWELRYWANKLPSGSLIAVHDWLKEVQEKRVPKGLEPYCEKGWEKARFAVWKIP